jgi:antitoxin ParD1/3/4
MSRNTMSFALPESLQAYIDERVRSGGYGNASEYIRDLVRRDQETQTAQRLRALIAEGLQSGTPRMLTDEVVGELRDRAFDVDR